jgi:hypothetical protein
MLPREGTVPYEEARAAIGGRAFDAIVVPIIIEGQSVASLTKSYAVQQVVKSARLRLALDCLADHLASAPKGPCASAVLPQGQ